MKKVYVIMSTQQDCEYNDWDVLEGDEVAFATKELAQKYINKYYVSSENYFILELKLIDKMINI